ncbi:MAG: GerMN domain-containing protein [Clostridia bacterium]|nr:GerMN domain-containing protein [Clostridia bacterium]
MKSKKIIIIYVLVFIAILILGVMAIKYAKDKKNGELVENEYIPEQEITDEQFRQTIVSLYFINQETGKVEPEARRVDIKDIINIPYDKILDLLLEGPKNDKLKAVIPNGTKVNKTYTEKDNLVIDFSAEILNFDKEQKDKLIKSIVNTMTELTEINSVKIVVDGNEVDEFNQIYIREK